MQDVQAAPDYDQVLRTNTARSRHENKRRENVAVSHEHGDTASCGASAAPDGLNDPQHRQPAAAGAPLRPGRAQPPRTKVHALRRPAFPGLPSLLLDSYFQY